MLLPFALVLFWKGISFASATAEGTVSVQLIYKEGYEVTGVKMNGETMVPTTVLIDGKPSLELNIDWSNNAVVRNAKTGQEITIQFEKPNDARSVIGNDSKLNLEIKPQKLEKTDKKGNFEGKYHINVIY